LYPQQLEEVSVGLESMAPGSCMSPMFTDQPAQFIRCSPRKSLRAGYEPTLWLVTGPQGMRQPSGSSPEGRGLWGRLLVRDTVRLSVAYDLLRVEVGGTCCVEG